MKHLVSGDIGVPTISDVDGTTIYLVLASITKYAINQCRNILKQVKSIVHLLQNGQFFTQQSLLYKHSSCSFILLLRFVLAIIDYISLTICRSQLMAYIRIISLLKN